MYDIIHIFQRISKNKTRFDQRKVRRGGKKREKIAREVGR